MGRNVVACETGLAGAQALAAEATVVIVVDVLSFSTAVDVAVGRGAMVVPFADRDPDRAAIAAAGAGALLAGRRAAPARHGYSLSPQSLLAIPAGTRLLLPSPNGSRISAALASLPVLAGCLRNATAVAAVAARLAGDGTIAVIAAGEHWPDGSLRPAIEDLLGAGAIVDRLTAGDGALQLSAEAEVVRGAYRSLRERLAEVVATSVSGRELIGWGFAGDVELAAALDVSRAAPLLADGAFEDAAMPDI